VEEYEAVIAGKVTECEAQLLNDLRPHRSRSGRFMNLTTFP
jgi:hypothetical protein